MQRIFGTSVFPVIWIFRVKKGLLPRASGTRWQESLSHVRFFVSDSLCSPWNSPGQNSGVGSLSLLQGGLPNPGIKPRSPELQADSLPSELPGKPKNTGVGSLSLLQQIFLTQESNQGLLHCKRILYQLSYQGGPRWHECISINFSSFTCS